MVLIKVVVKAILSLAMSCLRFPIGLFKDIECMIMKIRLGIRNERKGIYWKAWDQLYRLKEDGGLGFRYFEIF